MADLVIAPEDPRTPDVVELLEAHLAFAMATTQPENVHALDLAGLLDPSIELVTARRDGELLGVGALKRLDGHHGELKSMHTAASARRSGVAAALVEHLIARAREQGLGRLSLETGSQDAFAPARALYAAAGFEPCGPFGEYPDVPTSTFMTRRI